MGYFLNNGCYILGLTGPTGTVIDNNYAFFQNQNQTVTSETLIPLNLQFSGGTPQITVSDTTITLPAPGTYYVSFSLTGRFGVNQNGTVIPIINGSIQDRYASTNNTNSNNPDVTIADGFLVQSPATVSFYYVGSTDVTRVNFFSSIFKVSNS